MLHIQFADRMVSYETFMDDLASRIADKMSRRHDDPEMISQRQAFQLFGRGNVERWLRQGKLHIRKRPGKVEYLTAELRLAQETTQDYFN